jgi:hypothetical protein
MRFQAGTLAAVLILSAAPAFAQSDEVAGRIKLMSGSVVVVRGDRAEPARVGQAVFQSDTLRTGTDGRVGLTLKDDTRVSLGPDSEMRLDAFRYAPAEGSFSLVMSFLRGVAAYASGRIAKLSPDAVRLETPAAIVGVRGTTIGLAVEP